jgi:predicted transcriptional regulator
MATKEALRRLIDEMPDEEAERLLHTLGDPIARALAPAPVDDEPLTPEDVAAIEEGIADIEAGRVVRDEQPQL